MARRNIVIGTAWMLYTASWFFQVIKGVSGRLPGWEAFLTALTLEGVEESTGLVKRIIMVSSSLTNFLMILSPAILFWKKLESLKPALPWLLILAAILDAQWLILWGLEFTDLRAGYYLWCASFLVLAIGCFLNQRRGAHPNKALQPTPDERPSPGSLDGVDLPVANCQHDSGRMVGPRPTARHTR